MYRKFPLLFIMVIGLIPPLGCSRKPAPVGPRPRPLSQSAWSSPKCARSSASSSNPAP